MNLRDVMERRFSEMPTRLEASLADRVKDRVRKAFCGCLWRWSLPIQKRVFRLVKRLVHERRWHRRVEVGFVDQFIESDAKPAKQLEVVAKDIPNLFYAGMKCGFHDHLAESDMEIVEHLVVDNLVDVGGELHVVEHLFVRNEISSVMNLACVDGDLHITMDVEFVDASVDSLVVVVDEDFLMKHYVQFFPRSEHTSWMVEILVFDRMMQMWMMCRLVFLSLLE